MSIDSTFRANLDRCTTFHEAADCFSSWQDGWDGFDRKWQCELEHYFLDRLRELHNKKLCSNCRDT